MRWGHVLLGAAAAAAQGGTVAAGSMTRGYAAEGDGVTGSTVVLSATELPVTALCEGNFTIKYKSGINGGWKLHAENSSVQTMAVFVQCEEVRGNLNIDALTGTGDGEPSAAPLGAEVTVPSLPHLKRVENITLTGAFHDLQGLSALETVALDLRILRTNELVRIAGLDSLQTVGGDIVIEENYVLKDISGFRGLKEVGGSLNVRRNHELVSISGFSSLQSVGSAVKIASNFALQEIAGLSKVAKVAGAHVPSISNYIRPGHITCVVDASSVEANVDVPVSQPKLTQLGQGAKKMPKQSARRSPGKSNPNKLSQS